MRVALDLDGVVYEWERTARYMLRTYFPNRYEFSLRQESKHWDWIKEQVQPEDWRWLWTAGVEKGLFRHGHVVKDALVGIERLAEAGHTIIYVTHRPEVAFRDTMGWLYAHELPIANLHVMGNGANKTDVAWDLLIDDKADNYYRARQQGRLAYLYDRPWNRHGGAERAYGWLGDHGVVERVSESDLRSATA